MASQWWYNKEKDTYWDVSDPKLNKELERLTDVYEKVEPRPTTPIPPEPEFGGFDSGDLGALKTELMQYIDGRAGDMTRATYDRNANGVVDEAETARSVNVANVQGLEERLAQISGGSGNGTPGGYYIPSVNSNGDLSWSNTMGLSNPQTVNVRGPKGDKGDPGQAATITVGTVTTLAAGAKATVTNSGTSSAAVLNFGILQGAKGDKGEQGEDGAGAASSVPNKWAVLVVAGQSNAVGYDESAPNMIFDVQRDANRVKQLGYWTNNKEICDLGFCAQNYQDMRALGYKNGGTKGMHLPLANMLLDYIPSDYGVLVLPCAFGGTSFGSDSGYDAENMKVPNNANTAKWGVNGSLYKATKDRLKMVLDWNTANVLLGVVWVQGEHGASDPNNNNTNFDAMTTQFFADFANYRTRTRRGVMDKSIWFNVETTFKWYEQSGVQQIWAHYKEWNPDTYVEVPRDPALTNGLPNGGGNGTPNRNVPDGTAWTGTQTTGQYMTHFGNNAYATVIAPRVLRAMLNNGCLFYNAMYDKDTIGGGTEELEAKVTELESLVQALKTAMEEHGIDTPSAGEWKPVPAAKMTQIFGTDAQLAEGSISFTNKSGAILDSDLRHVKFTVGNPSSGSIITMLTLYAQTVPEAGSASGYDLYDLTFAFGSSSNGLLMHTTTGETQAKLCSNGGTTLFNEGNDIAAYKGAGTYEVEYIESDKHIKITCPNGTTLEADMSAKISNFDAQYVRFGFSGYNTNFGARITDLQYLDTSPSKEA